ncbi:hypothetical protein ACWEOA_11550 [Streptomyces sp. NPDC004457]|uniref:hypothetical protein n=1 Tax=Streptomyces spinosus TaxID=2872623 RepID=UPI001CEC875F|nr:hypothetical protein [Streptomyces spinosus]
MSCHTNPDDHGARAAQCTPPTSMRINALLRDLGEEHPGDEEIIGWEFDDELRSAWGDGEPWAVEYVAWRTVNADPAGTPFEEDVIGL